jgi:HSP20 family protein
MKPGTQDSDSYRIRTGSSFLIQFLITLLADMPGVKAADLNIDLRDDTLTLTGAVAPLNGPEENDVLIEYGIGTYSRQFSLSEVIDQGKIDAQLSDGVLRLRLPKAEKAAPRTITVKAG